MNLTSRRAAPANPNESRVNAVDPGSFRDPAGFVYESNGRLLRQINTGFEDDYGALIDSGLADALVQKNWLVPHSEVDLSLAATDSAALVIAPRRIPFISFPYEWSFHQFQAAAELTLSIAELAFDHGMVLKDASAYNIQFDGTKPVFIDTLSFARYEKGAAWIAYRQYCQHFLAPLALMSYVEPTLNLLMQSSIDGITLPTAKAMLPRRAFLRPGLFTHIYLHAKSVEKYADSAADESAEVTHTATTGSMSELGFRGLLDSLKSTVKGLPWRDPKTEWGDYYAATNYSDEGMQAKAEAVKGYLGIIAESGLAPSGHETNPTRVFDLGANTGQFSQIAAELGYYTIAADIDSVAVDRNFRHQHEQKREGLLPLRIDLSAPSPAIGWNNQERPAFLNRLQPDKNDTVMALALIHHLAIGNHTPLAQIAQMFADVAQYLIIEFVPKADSQVKRLLATRKDVFPNYTSEGFEAAFETHFETIRKLRIQSTARDLYLLKHR